MMFHVRSCAPTCWFHGTSLMPCNTFFVLYLFVVLQLILLNMFCRSAILVQFLVVFVILVVTLSIVVICSAMSLFYKFINSDVVFCSFSRYSCIWRFLVWRIDLLGLLLAGLLLLIHYSSCSLLLLFSLHVGRLLLSDLWFVWHVFYKVSSGVRGKIRLLFWIVGSCAAFSFQLPGFNVSVPSIVFSSWFLFSL